MVTSLFKHVFVFLSTPVVPLRFVHTRILIMNQHRKEITHDSTRQVALGRTFVELFNAHQSDSAWLDKALTSLSEDCEIIDVPSGWTSGGPNGYKQLLLFFADGFPSGSVEITNVFATEDQLVG